MKLKITVHGVAYEVEVEVLDPGEGFAIPGPLPPVSTSARPAPAPSSAAVPAPPAASTRPPTTPASESAVSSPIAGTVLEVRCKPGEQTTQGQVLLVLEAMKMNTSIASPIAGRLKSVLVAAGDVVREGQPLVEFE